jgi:hypothetical protein
MPSNTRLPREEVLWKIFHNVHELLVAGDLTKAEARQRIHEQLAAVYEVPVENINAYEEATIYTIGSKILRLLFPVSGRARANLQAAMLKGISFNDALLIARGRYERREDIPRAKTSVMNVEATKALPLAELLTSLVELAKRKGYTSEEIETALDDARDASDARNET